MAKICSYGQVSSEVVFHLFDIGPVIVWRLHVVGFWAEGTMCERDETVIHLNFDQGCEMYLAQWGLKPRDMQEGAE